ncbi:response regulator transcription factor [Pandoraea sp.]|nr:response regulator transcription factor [Pandoraea sp.]TAL53597.1 MAG: response regulator transcription factor [Pandoraea sp.]
MVGDMSQTQIRLLIADDHPVVALGVQATLKSLVNAQVVGVAQNSTELFKILESDVIDIVITDYAMPGGAYGDGIEMLTRLKQRYPQVKLIVLTVLTNTALLGNIGRLGVHGLLNKASEINEIPLAIDRVSKGFKYFGKAVSAALQEHMIRPDADRVRSLSKREMEVLRMYLGGMPVKDIANHLRRSGKTVSNQKRIAMTKLGCSSDAELFQYYALLGLTDTPTPKTS